MRIAHRVKLGLVLAAVISIGWMGACSDNPGGPDDTIVPPSQGLVVSDPTVALNASVPVSRTATGAAGSEDVAYASLMPSTAPQGSIASVRAVVSGSLVWTTVIDGGFDPVAVMAGDGDTIEVVVRDALGAEVHVARAAVAASRRPVIVRTEPPPRKRDVPLNSTVVVVFSEPIDATSLTSASVRLFRGPFPVGGTASLVPGSGAVIAFQPSVQLAANAEYRLVVTTAIRDLQGDALVAGTTVSFRTVATLLGTPESVSISPDTVVMIGATYQLTAVVRDSDGNRLTFQPVTWTSTHPSSLAVSSTGLLTASAAGHYWVTALAGGAWDTAGVFVKAGPAASVAITPSPAVVGVGDTISLTATVRDANGRLMKDALVTWTSNDTTIATVTSTGADTSGLVFATVTGVRLGSLTIAATSGAASGTTSVTVGPRVQAVSLNVTPESATVLVQRTVRLSAALRDARGRVTLGHPVAWTSDNSAVATVDMNGLVTAVGPGSAAVSATSDSLADTAAVTVPVPEPLVTIEGQWVLSDDAWHRVDQDGDGYEEVVVVCSDTGIVTFSQNSHLFTGTSTLVGCTPGSTAITDGYVAGATLTLTAGSCSYTLHTYTPNQPADLAPQRFNGEGSCSSSPYYRTWNGARPGTTAGIVITPASREVSRGRTVQLTASAVDAVGASLPFSISWSSDNPSVATVSPTGLVTGVAVGSATITATADGRSETASITVSELIFSTVSADFNHTCGTTADSTYCWGQIVTDANGNPLWTTSGVPVPVSGGLHFASVSVGYEHMCGLTTAGAAYCWGGSAYGKLGNGTSTVSGTPVAVSGGLTFASLSAGFHHTCGVTTTGAAYCWGYNAFGQLGTGDTAVKSYPVPTQVGGDLVFAAVSAASLHTCGVTTTGAAYCWGRNEYGQLGTGASDQDVHPTPVAVMGGLTFASVSAGGESFTCGLTTTGVVYCWGRGGRGQLGIGAINDQAYPSPTQVAGGHEFRMVSTNRGPTGRTCGVTTQGASLCWGDIGGAGFVGEPSPVPVAEGLILSSVTVGNNHACAQTPGGQVYCWGGNWSGQLGDGSFVDRSVPVQVVRHP